VEDVNAMDMLLVVSSIRWVDMLVIANITLLDPTVKLANPSITTDPGQEQLRKMLMLVLLVIAISTPENADSAWNSIVSVETNQEESVSTADTIRLEETAITANSATTEILRNRLLTGKPVKLVIAIQLDPLQKVAIKQVGNVFANLESLD